MTYPIAQVRLAEGPVLDLDLVPRLELGDEQIPILSRRLTVGAPVMFAIPPTSVETGTQLAAYLLAQAGTSSYYFLDLAVSPRPDKAELFTDLGVGVQLACDAAAPNQPIAWSLSPMRSATSVPVRRTVGITVKAVIVEPKMERQTEVNREEDFVVAYGLRESSFEWRYRASQRRGLDGILQMQAVIQAPAGFDVRADVVVAATLQLPGYGFGRRRYRADLPAQVRSVVGSDRSQSTPIVAIESATST
ncbi:hypothetical protein [Paractinoplanes atraurantiacus]|uniref:Uncharacterized protein n=1 Tax=Paractinoplanes atraurantiacus TaxID=1036182 RepID=A0A285GRB3_9ACTN|nr:hypothetical protein [Actinoplanes atraurantiacus]SNY25774.1 hypothetical protein SAMN05421748_102406 [Actinoplanes atraurantiacus]